jgi:hypothetical protein
VKRAAQDLLDEAINIIEATGAGLGDAGLASRANAVATGLRSQRDKFFFKSLVGVPLANKAKGAAEAVARNPSTSSVAALEAVLAEIGSKADAPGTVLT